MRILIGQSYYLRFDPKLWEAMQPYPPLGSLYAAGYLRDAGFDVRFFDAMLAESTDRWGKALADQRPDVAVIYEDNFNYLSKMCLLRMREAAFEMIRMARQQGIQVIVSGSDATDQWKEYLRAGAEFVIVGEGEETLKEVLLFLAREGPEPTKGLVSRNLPEAPVSRTPLRELDRLPFPAWDLVDLERYQKIWLEQHGYFSINMVTTRGCPYHCNWCAKPIWGQRYNSRSPSNVVEEIALLKSRIQIDHIWFADDIFGLKKGWLSEFSELITTRNLQTPFKCLLRTDLVNTEAANALKRAGCRTVWLGAESGSQKVLDAMEKGATVSDTYRATRLLRERGIEVGLFIQFGYPGEEWEDIERTLSMIWDVMPDDVGVSVSYPLPGTKFHETIRARLGDQQHWVDSNDLALLFPGKYSKSFYRQLHRVLHLEYRARKAIRNAKSGSSLSLRPVVKSVLLPFEKFKLHQLRKAETSREDCEDLATL